MQNVEVLEVLSAPDISGVVRHTRNVIAEKTGLQGAVLDKLIDKITQQYTLFMRLKAEHTDLNLVPSEFVDDMWHCHHLRNRSYEEYCRWLGVNGLVYHDPDVKKSNIDDGWKRTKRLLEGTGLRLEECEFEGLKRPANCI